MSSNNALKQKINLLLVTSSVATQRTRETPQFKEEERAYNKFSVFLYKEGNKDNIKNILLLEDSILEFKLNSSDDSKERESLIAGRERLESAIGALNNVVSYKNFVVSLKSYGIKTVDRQGLPLDGFRTTIPGQIISIQNINRDDKARHLKDFNEARMANLSRAEKLYKSIQHAYMQRFIKDFPTHQLARNYMSIPSNQKRIAEQQKICNKTKEIER